VKGVGVLGLVLATVLAAGCGSSSRQSSGALTGSSATVASKPAVRTPADAQLVSPLRLPLLHSRILPGYLLVADRNNDRILLLSPHMRIANAAAVALPDGRIAVLGSDGSSCRLGDSDALTRLSRRRTVGAPAR
jgi:hypothetical protein